MSVRFAWAELREMVRDGDPRPGPSAWQAWAEPVIGDPYQWTAVFSASVPHDFVAAFAASLAAPTPVLRRNPPELSISCQYAGIFMTSCTPRWGDLCHSEP